MIFKILIFGIAAYALYRLFMNDKRKNIEKSENDEAKKIDRRYFGARPGLRCLCGERKQLFRAERRCCGIFCSDDCRQKYIKQVQEQQKIQE